jgi:hypothetical protein
MSEGKAIEIRAPFSAGGTTVTVDGQEVTGVVCVTLTHRVGEPPKVILELLAHHGAVASGVCEVETREICPMCKQATPAPNAEQG